MPKIFYTGAIFLLIVLVFYFSWKPTPDIETSWYMPGWLADWSNEYGRLRTGVPFVFMGLMLSFSGKNYNMYVLGMLVLVTVAELGQLWLSDRHFDWMDIVDGVLGGVLGLLVGKVSSATLTHLVKK
jgi:glycopeptide antibiotics resistance protein